MNVLLFTNLYPSKSEPVRGVFNQNRFVALSRYAESRIVAPLPWWSRIRRPGEWFLAPRDATTGIDAVFPTYWSLPGISSIHARAMHASVRPLIRRLQSEFPVDVVLAAWAYPDAVAAARLASEMQCPLVTMVLGSDINELARQPELRKQIQWALGQSHRVIAVSDALRRGVIDLGIASERIIVQHNGVDGNRFAVRDRTVARKRLGVPLDRRVICYIGNFKPEKGVDVLIEAMYQACQSGTRDVELALVGGGVMEAQLRSRVHELQLDTHVRFCGRRPHEEVPEWISASDVLCLPSYREGCPNVVLESLASGRPVVASHVGGVPELLDTSTGILVPPGDAVALAKGLSESLARTWDPDALRASVRCLSWDQFGQTLIKVLENAVETSRSACQTTVHESVGAA